MSCEDFPACGHESGCCPDFDPETGKQMNMRCTCGAVVPLTSRSSICAGCLRRGSEEDGDFYEDFDDSSEDDLDEDDEEEDEEDLD